MEGAAKQYPTDKEVFSMNRTIILGFLIFISIVISTLILLSSILPTAEADKEPIWSESTDDLIHSVAMSGDGEYMVSGGREGILALYRQDSSTHLWEWDAGTRIMVVAMSDDGWHIVAATNDSRTVYFNRSSSTPVWTYTGSDMVMSLDISWNGSFIVAGGRDKNITLFRNDSPVPRWQYTTTQWVDSVALSENGSRIVAGSRDKNVYYFSSESSDPLWSYTTGGTVKSVGITDDGTHSVAASSDNYLYYFSEDNSSAMDPIWKKRSIDIDDTAISGNGEYITSFKYSDRINVFDRNGTFINGWDVDTSTGDVAFSHDGDKLAVQSGSDYLFLIDKDCENPLWEYFFPANVGGIAISADGLWIIAGGDNNRVALFGNDDPIAEIRTMNPNPALLYENILFRGDSEDDDSNLTHVWISDIDGELYNGTDDEFTNSSLSLGTHSISYLVRDSFGVWSDLVTSELIVHRKPVAFITNITPTHPNLGEEVLFNGSGDDDGVVNRYSWFSSIDDDLFYGPSPSFTTSDLSVGLHTITLRVKDDQGSWSDPIHMELKVNSPPTCWIVSQSLQYAVSGDTLYFNGSSSDPGGSVEEYEWTMTGPDQVERYRCDTPHMVFDPQTVPDLESWFLPGNFTISYRVCDDNGLWSDAKIASLIVHERPTVEIDVIDGTVFPVNTVLQIPGIATDEEPIEPSNHRWIIRSNTTQYEWFRFGSTLFKALDPGEYTIEYWVVDVHGASSETDTSWIAVRTPPTIDAVELSLIHSDGQIMLVLYADASGEGDIMLYSWSSSRDGELGNTTTSDHSVSNLSLGDHTITVLVRDSNGLWSEEATETIVVHSKPIAVISYIDPSPSHETQSVDLQAGYIDDGYIVRYRWHSSLDGYFYNGSNDLVSHASLTAGNHTITLTVQDNHGVWSEPVNTWLIVEEWVIGYDGPIVVILSPRQLDIVSGVVNVTGYSRDDLSTIIRIDISFDDRTWVHVHGFSYDQVNDRYDYWYLWDTSEIEDDDVNNGMVRITVRAQNERGSDRVFRVSVFPEGLGGGEEGDDGFSFDHVRWDMGIAAGIMVVILIFIGYLTFIFDWNTFYRKYPWVRPISSTVDWLFKHPITSLKFLVVFALLIGAIGSMNYSWLFLLCIIIVGSGVFFMFTHFIARDSRKIRSQFPPIKASHGRPRSMTIPVARSTESPPSSPLDTPAFAASPPPPHHSVSDQSVSPIPEVPEDRSFSFYKYSDREPSEIDEDLVHLLSQAQHYGLLAGWDINRFKQHTEEQMNEVSDEPRDYSWLEHAITCSYEDGFLVDWRFASDHVLSWVNTFLKKHGLSFLPAEPDARDEMLDPETGLRKISLIFTAPDTPSVGAKDPKIPETKEPRFPHIVTFKTPADIIRFVNRMIRPYQLVFLEREEGGDSYEFALFSVRRADEMLRDDRFTFHTVA